MEIETLFRNALQMSVNAIGRHVTQELSDRYSDKAILFGTEYTFELEEYLQTMEFPCEADPNVFQHVTTEWEGQGEELSRETASGWYRIRWQGHPIEVGLLSWTDGSCEQRYHWIVASTRALAERFLQAVCDWGSDVHGEVLVFQGGAWRKDDDLYRAIQNADFDNLVLPPALKEEIQTDFRQFFASRALYDRYRIPWKRGVLLLGPPGNGKTHMIKALVNMLGKPCLYVKSFKARYLTDHQAIQNVFQRARQTTPCLLVMEDLDSLINDNNRAFFLNELDGFAANTGVVVIATTNHPEKLDPALLERPSRFDRKYTFTLPAPEERAAYITHWNAALEPEMQLSPEGLAEVVGLTEGFSFAYLKELFVSSMMRWIVAPQAGGMDAAMQAQALQLCEQIHREEKPTPDTEDEEDEDD